jgi:uncharacterized protein (DUF433 family)
MPTKRQTEGERYAANRALVMSTRRQGARSPGIYPVPENPHDNKPMQDAITRDPEVMHGKPVFHGTRIPVQTLFDYLECGDSLEEFLEGFSTVGRQLAIQVLEECKNLRLAGV